MEKLFGTDGVRGRAGEFPLDQPTVTEIARSLARKYREVHGRAPRFVTGRDTRESGSWIEAAFHAGAVAEGAECESAGVITTPGVAYVTGEFGFEAGIVISASHNPFEDNGIKIFTPNGKKVGAEIERAIERDIFTAMLGNGNEPEMRNVDDSRAAEFQSSYLENLGAKTQDLRLENMGIVVDCANGAASHLAPDLFSRLGARVTTINNKPDGRNINKDCGSLHLDALCAKVLEEHADFGVAFDGDADRALFVDEKGRVIDGDATLWIMTEFMLANGGLKNRTVVSTLMSNLGLEVALAAIGIKLVRTAVGDKYVLDELINSDSELGGEQSGHIIFPRDSLVGDGMMTALFMLKAIATQAKPFSQMTDGFTRYPQILVNVAVREKLPFEDVPAISTASRQIEGELDGNGRLLLRYSGTENLARVMIEGKDQSTIERQARDLADVIKASIG